MRRDHQFYDNSAINPLTLRFDDAQLENEYERTYIVRFAKQTRIGAILGAGLWLIYSLIDSLQAAPEYQRVVWVIASIILALALLVFASTIRLKFFKKYGQALLVFTAISSSLAVVYKMYLLPEFALIHFFPGLMLIVFWCHCFSGMRFSLATLASLFTLVFFDIFIWFYHPLPLLEIANYNFYIVAATIIALVSGYAAERNSRILYLEQRSLDAQRKLHLKQSLHDALTGLPNRTLLEDRLGKAISSSVRDKNASAAIFIDLDGFKEVNDTYGHDVGDLLLQEVSNRLTRIVREADTLSRISGDEFIILAIGIKTKASVITFVDKLLKAISEPYAINNLAIYGITASVGICMFPYRDCSVTDIMRRADLAMYQVKRAGKAGKAFAEIPKIKKSIKTAQSI